MTLEKARELIAMHVDPGSGYNRNAARMVPGESCVITASRLSIN
jgi:hypothetical protein